MAFSHPGFMFKGPSTRRQMLTAAITTPALALPAMLGMSGTAAAGIAYETLEAPEETAPGHIRYGHLTFRDKAEKMRAKIRLEFGSEDKTYLWWYTFTLFAVTPQRSPLRLLRFEGMEMSEWRSSGPNDYIVHGHNVSFPQDYETGAYLSKWENPITQKTVKTQPTLLTSDPGRRKTIDGDYDLSDKTKTLRLENSVLRVEGDLVHKDDVRNPPEDWPGQFVETSTVTASLNDLRNSDLPSLNARGSGMWVQPYLKWMGMPKNSGHLIGYFNGRKLPGIEALPKPFYSRLMGEHKDLSYVDPAKFSGEYWEKNQSGLLNVD